MMYYLRNFKITHRSINKRTQNDDKINKHASHNKILYRSTSRDRRNNATKKIKRKYLCY